MNFSGFTKFSSNEAKESLKLDVSVNKVDVALTYQAKVIFFLEFFHRIFISNFIEVICCSFGH
jgi:hypothetical protein